MGFLVPLFAAFAVVAAIPILVHLYGRPRAVRRRFAAIRFLLESDRKTAVQRRVRELALLVLRAVAIAAVPLLLAKPYFETRSEVVAGIGESESAVIVLDDSRSMGFRTGGLGGATLFTEAQARARRLVAGLGRDAECAVLLTSQGAAAPQPELTADRTRLVAAIDEVKPSLRPGDTGAALRRAAAILSASAAAAPHKARRVYLLSDMAAHSLPEGAPWGQDGPSLVPVDIGRRLERPAAGNRAVREVRVQAAPQLGPRGVELTVTVENHGAEPAREVPITLRVDGKPVAKGLLDLPARGRAEKRFSHVFSGEGEGEAASATSAAPDERGAAPSRPGPSARVHDVVVELGEDALPSDDRRYLRIEERRGLRALLVDGDPRTVRRADELFYLETALRPGEQDEARIAVRTTTLEDLPAAHLESEDVVFVANVKAPDADRAARLRAFVESGGGLLLAVGDNVDPDAWNQALSDLLPQPLATLRTVGPVLRSRDDGESVAAGVPAGSGAGEHVARLDRDHPVLAPFQGEGGGGVGGGGFGVHGPAQALREALIGRYALLKPTPQSGDGERRALLRLDSGAPLLVEGKLGRGRVLLLTTTVDRDWGDLAIQPGFLPLMQQAARYLARAPLDAPAPSSLLGEPHEIPLLDGDVRAEVTLPSGARRPFGEDRVARRATLHFSDTLEPGLYHVAAAREGEPLAPHPEATFAVDVDAGESDLAPVDKARLAALTHPVASSGPGSPTRRIELWRELGAVLLALLLLESILTLRR